MITVTQLFLMYEKPVREGVYKLARIDRSADIWSYWCGGQWGEPAPVPEFAKAYYIIRGGISVELGVSAGAIIGWRGLADDPNA